MRLILIALILVSACVAVSLPDKPDAPIADTVAVQPPPVVINPYAEQRKAWRAASCPVDAKPTPATPLAITAEAVSGKPRERLIAGLPKGVTLAGAWILNADNPNFGGLSGLDTMEGGLLAITDAGAFVTIALDKNAPSGKGTIAYMRGANGATLSGKIEADSEGLVYEDGLAMVSFERTHRIEAFDLARCGEAARAVRVADLPASVRGKALDENQGAEPLWTGADGALQFGFEMPVSGAAPLGAIDAQGMAALTATRAVSGNTMLVGADSFTDSEGRTRTAFLARGFSPLTGAVLDLSWGEDAGERFTLKRPMPVDNFESVAAEMLANGRLRLWIISDDNFNDVQQTLLYAFDITL